MGGRGGGLELAKSLLQKALGSNAAAALSNIRQSIEAMPFGFLRNVDSQNLLTYIIDEHPQTIALIMSHLPANIGAEILAGLPEARRLSVIRRIATMGRTNPDIIREVEKGLERRMSSVMSQSFENAGGVGAVAEMLNVSDRATERALMESLKDEDPELVEEIRRLMFVFEDISRFADKDIQTVLKNVETSQWAMALKGASEALKEKVLKNMSERAAETLREEMEYLGPGEAQRRRSQAAGNRRRRPQPRRPRRNRSQRHQRRRRVGAVRNGRELRVESGRVSLRPASSTRSALSGPQPSTLDSRLC